MVVPTVTARPAAAGTVCRRRTGGPRGPSRRRRRVIPRRDERRRSGHAPPGHHEELEVGLAVGFLDHQGQVTGRVTGLAQPFVQELQRAPARPGHRVQQLIEPLRHQIRQRDPQLLHLTGRPAQQPRELHRQVPVGLKRTLADHDEIQIRVLRIDIDHSAHPHRRHTVSCRNPHSGPRPRPPRTARSGHIPPPPHGQPCATCRNGIWTAAGPWPSAITASCMAS